MVSSLPTEWCFDRSSGSLAVEDAEIRVIALRPGDAALISGARAQVQDLYQHLYASSGYPVARAKKVVGLAFEGPQDSAEDETLARTVLAYYETDPASPSGRTAAFARVTFDGERVIISPVGVASELPRAAQQLVLHAVTLATEELALTMAAGTKSDQLVMVWRGQVGAPDYLKQLFEHLGYRTKHTERLEMAVFLNEVALHGSAEGYCLNGFEIRPLDLARGDILKVYDVAKGAFGPNPPSFEAWKRHYPQQPRFAPDLSFVA